jgi:hypothetical protein
MARKSIYVPASGKGNIDRPPNLTCRYCTRKKVYPQREGRVWRYPAERLCFDCTMRQHPMFDEIRKRRPRKAKSLSRAFPLTIMDITNNVLVGEYDTKDKIQKAIDRYRQRKSRASIIVINYPDYYDFTSYFINTG